jgi:2,4-dienoyl-CoA reductase-like NADH-dependent reductase (Old Yellow Enzyme family)
VELLKSIRQAIGKDKILIIRLNGEELMDDHGGNGRSECIEFMKMAEQAGTDCVSIVVGWHESTRGALAATCTTISGFRWRRRLRRR